MTFSFVYHSLIWTWTLTFCKVHIVSKTTCLTWISIYLLLACQGLFKLHLLLNFLLFICQNWMFTLWLFKRVCHVHYLVFLFYRRYIHRICHSPRVAHIINKVALFLLTMNISSSSLHFIVDLLSLSIIVNWRIIAALDHRIWNTLMLILIRVHIKWLTIRLRRSNSRMLFNHIWSNHFTSRIDIDTIVFLMLWICRLAWQIRLVLCSGISSLMMKQLRVSYIIICRLRSLTCQLIHCHLMIESLFYLLLLCLCHISKVVKTFLALNLTLLVAQSLFSSTFSTYRFTAHAVLLFLSFYSLLL